eukprot:gene25287-31724_t
MTAGRYLATFVLRNEKSADVFYAASSVQIPVEVRPSEEFIPTYDWQTLHAWHTIPSGIVTRLPLSSSHLKEARIPDPFRLQLSLPSPCKYFLRMDAKRGTTVGEIKKKAASTCKFPPECFILYADNSPLDDPTATVENTQLFIKSKRLELDETNCAVLIEKYRSQLENKGTIE